MYENTKQCYGVMRYIYVDSFIIRQSTIQKRFFLSRPINFYLTAAPSLYIKAKLNN